MTSFLMFCYCEDCGELAGIFARQDFPVTVQNMQHGEIEINPQTMTLRNFHVYCARCAPPGTLRIEGKCPHCNKPVEVHTSNYADIAPPEESVSLIRVVPDLIAGGTRIAWCSEEHLDVQRRGMPIERRLIRTS